jgi:hypothetical protein
MSQKKAFSMLFISLFVFVATGCGGGVSSQVATASPPGSGAGTATIHWNAVTTYTDTTLINTTGIPTGYKIHYGTAPGYYTTTVNITISQLADRNSPRYTITGLSQGTRYYFAVSAYDSSNVDSSLSAEVSKIIS